MAIYHVLLLAIFSTMMLSCYAGPAGQIALAAARASKIPRAIRASFRNPEIGVARGFGKRTPSQMYKESEIPWSMRKEDSSDVDDSFQQILREMPQDGISIDWLANEMSTNPFIAKLILHRLVDNNRDGILSANELLPNDLNEF